MGVTAAVRSRLHATLRRQRPASVVVYRSDSDDATTITPTGERGRWERVVAAVPPMAERIELRDAKGNVLSALDLEPADKVAADDAADRDLKLLKLLTQAQQMAVEQQTQAIKGVTDAYEKLAKLLAERLTSLERGYSEVLKAAFESTLMAAEAEAKLLQQRDNGEENPLDGMAKAMFGKLLPKKGNVANGVDTAASQAQDASRKEGA